MFELKYYVRNSIKETLLGIKSLLTLNKISFSSPLFVLTLHQIIVFKKRKNPIKYNRVRTVHFRLPPQKINTMYIILLFALE